MLYLDTSALLKLYVVEEGSAATQQLIQAQSLALPVWEIQEMELTNALWLKVFRGEIKAGEAGKQLELFSDRRRRGLYYYPEISRSSLMDQFRRISRKSVKTDCRTLDVLHVACACELGAKHFVSFDDRQNRLAKGEGFQIGLGKGS